MKEKEFYTARELTEMFDLKPSHINYLKIEGIIPSIRRGQGYPALFPSEAVAIIKARLAKLNASE
ncbi:MAG: hypothetical protein ISS29_01795 [Candidatus Marinimicrobia bacterium]|nr:hypothetical protein [Candidatus Neomarinimicrobiota bacterium]